MQHRCKAWQYGLTTRSNVSLDILDGAGKYPGIFSQLWAISSVLNRRGRFHVHHVREDCQVCGWHTRIRHIFLIVFHI
jgi:hypothetical protein